MEMKCFCRAQSRAFNFDNFKYYYGLEMAFLRVEHISRLHCMQIFVCLKEIAQCMGASIRLDTLYLVIWR